MSNDRECPVCTQIVPSSMKGIIVKPAPGISKVLHEGCARLVKFELEKFDVRNSKTEG